MPGDAATPYREDWDLALRLFAGDRPTGGEPHSQPRSDEFQFLATFIKQPDLQPSATQPSATQPSATQPVIVTAVVSRPPPPPAVTPTASKPSGPSDLLLIGCLVLVLIIGIVAKTDLLRKLRHSLRPARRRGFEVILSRPPRLR
jgi:hypothetical protein